MDTALQPAIHKSNPVHAAHLLKTLAIAFMVGVIGLGFVFLKNQQFVLAEEIRQIERKIRHAQARNEVLLASVAEHSSRPALQKRLAQGLGGMMPIPSDKIARLTPPATAPESEVLRTAFNEESRR